tara:strand:- start:305 stop:1234 length:930 start_codon:yes stop_codon:yes gene_type:complete
VKKDIIIGAAVNYMAKDLYNFVLSLRKNYKANVLFFVSNNIDEETLNFFDKYKIHYEKTTQNTKEIFKKRYYLYLNYLKKNKFDRVMITDTRDVIFQKNPFNNTKFSNLCFFSEDKKIEECIYNSNWIINLYGKKQFETIKNNKIICSGTTIGKYKDIIYYLKVICKEIENTNNSKIAKDLRKSFSIKTFIGKSLKSIVGNKYYSFLKHKVYKGYTYVGTDQGNHNYLIYFQKIKKFKILSNKDGYVCTFGNADVKKYKVNNGVSNSEGLKFNILHQYDRIYKKNSKYFNNSFKKKFIKYIKNSNLLNF